MQTVVQRAQQRRAFGGRQHGQRMTVKREHPRLAADFTRPLNRAGEDQLVALVAAVKETRGQNHRPGDFAELRWLCDDVHEERATRANGTTRAASCAGVSAKMSSNGRASFTSKAPDCVRLRLSRHAPQPSAWPTSWAKVRT